MINYPLKSLVKWPMSSCMMTEEETRLLKRVLTECRYKTYSSLLNAHEQKDFIQNAYDMTKENVKEFYDNSTSTKWDHNAKIEELTRCHQIVIDCDNELTAFASISLEKEIEDDDESEDVLYLYELQVKTNQRSLGHGRRLLEEVVCMAKRMNRSQVMLTVFKHNPRAHRFYQGQGFTNHWSSPNDTDYSILSKSLE